jgi:hypothetical protein
VDAKQIADGNLPGGGPPVLDEHSQAAFDFYIENVSGFTSRVGVVADAVRELGLAGDERAMFLAKLNMIDQSKSFRRG